MLEVASFTSFNAVEGILHSLDDDNDDIVAASLETLNECVQHNWAEISEELSKIEELSEESAKNYSKLAALLASKVHYHIQSYQDALYHALQAQDLFRVDEGTEYSQKLTEQCIDSYREFQQYHYNLSHGGTEAKDDMDDDEQDIDVAADNNNEDEASYGLRRRNSTVIPKEIDPRLIKIVERMLDYCFVTGEYNKAIGIAIECRRLDYVEKAVRQSDNIQSTLSHTFKICESSHINSRAFKDELLTLVVTLYKELPNRNYPNICRCYFYLDNTKEISQILWNLIKTTSSADIDNSNNNDNDNDIDMSNSDSTTVDPHKRELICYQICFDLYEFQNESFTRAIFDNIPKPPTSQLFPQKATAEAQKKAEDAAAQGLTAGTDNNAAAANAETAGNNENNDTSVVTEPQEELWSDELLTRWKNVRSILLGEKIIPLYLDFLFRNNNSDFLILKQYKDAIPERNSTLNNSLVVCNGIMHCGTTVDQFLRDNLEWMGRAAHWAKFTATASLGMIHHHHLSQSMNILQRYLPGSGGGPYQEGGALYSLGLIHNGDSSDKTTIEIRNYLIKQLKNASNEILQHGACLGLGLAALGYAQQNLNEEAVIQNENTRTDAGTILSEIRNILFQDRAVPGEAAGLALGLILCGTGNSEWYDEMLAFCHETQHEKIIRGLALGIAIMHYGCEDRANSVIDTMIGPNEKDETIRYGGCYTIGLAYAATGNNDAIAKLLHVAVSDVSNDVRRAAVTNIGFVLCNNSKQVPKVVQLLANSYNSHVRYGAAAALGIACAGTGNSDAIKILKVLLKDNVDYVRQAALIALGMLLMEHNKYETPYVNELREDVFKKIITNKREGDMSKLGAILGAGILDGAGRNATIQLYNVNNKCKRQSAIIGMSVFWQYWYWYPLVPFIALTFKPTMVMCLNYQLNMVKLQFKSNVISNMFEYAEKLKEETKEKKKTLVKAVLSITQKQKAREAKRQKEKEKEAAEQAAADAAPDTDIDMTKDNANNTSEKPGTENDKEADKGDKDKEKDSDKMEIDTENDKDNDKDKDKDKTEGDIDVETKPKDENGDDDKKDKKVSKSFELLENPSRVTPNQTQYIEWIDDRYAPINGRTTNFTGIVIVSDHKPSEEVKLVEQKTLSGAGVYGNEPEPPKPFKYLGD